MTACLLKERDLSQSGSNKIYIIDTTLREGNQAPGVLFTPSQSLQIANFLITIGVDMIEIGHPYASKMEMDRTKAIVNNSNKDILAHARAKICDIEKVFESGAQWVGIFAGVNEISQKYRLGKTKKEIFSCIKNSISMAKKLNLKVRYTAEDSSRTTTELLIETYNIAIDAGADRICFADTVGILEPHQTFNIIMKLKEAFPNIPIEIHFHDDRGLAMANVLSAIEAGATWISSSINGLGERCGIPDTCALMVNLHFKYKKSLPHFNDLIRASRLVSKISLSPPDCRRPIIGKNAFLHTAKLHRDSVQKNETTYSWIKIETLNETLLATKQNIIH